MGVWDVYATTCGIAVGISLLLYICPLVFLTYFPGSQNLRERYGDWALVTGASSGIGFAITRKLASQGINVCVVALDDSNFSPSVEALRKSYPAVEFRPIPVNLAGEPKVYMDAIRRATESLPISIVISNAGFLLMGYFDEREIEAHMGNVECNLGAAIRISHFLYSRMIVEDRKGCIAFTSSAAWFIPAPYASIYGSSKAALSNFAVSLSIEARNHNIDVCVVHPSYTNTNLYEKNPRIGVLKVLSMFGWTSDDVASVLFSSVGRVVVRDAGLYSISTNILGRLVDSGTLAKLIMPFRRGMAPPPESCPTASR